MSYLSLIKHLKHTMVSIILQKILKLAAKEVIWDGNYMMFVKESDLTMNSLYIITFILVNLFFKEIKIVILFSSHNCDINFFK